MVCAACAARPCTHECSNQTADVRHMCCSGERSKDQAGVLQRQDMPEASDAQGHAVQDGQGIAVRTRCVQQRRTRIVFVAAGSWLSVQSWSVHCLCAHSVHWCIGDSPASRKKQEQSLAGSLHTLLLTYSAEPWQALRLPRTRQWRAHIHARSTPCTVGVDAHCCCRRWSSVMLSVCR